jgi:hypothetical protein
MLKIQAICRWWPRKHERIIDPSIILMAVPPGLAGVIVLLVITGSTLNVMSLMGIIMMVDIVVSNKQVSSAERFRLVLVSLGRTPSLSLCSRFQSKPSLRVFSRERIR